MENVMIQNQYCPGPELKNTAKEYLAGWYGTFISALLTAMMATIPIIFLQSVLESVIRLLLTKTAALFPAALVHLLSTVALAFLDLCTIGILRSLLHVGILLMQLKIACGSSFNFWDLFYCFSESRVVRTLWTAVFVMLPRIICTLPSMLFAWQFLQNASPRTGLYTLLVFFSGVLVCLPISLDLSMSYFLMLDFPEYSPGKILALSHKLMKGNKGRLFLLEVSFLPLHLLAVFSMGIGYLWLEPYINMTRTLFYLDLMKHQ